MLALDTEKSGLGSWFFKLDPRPVNRARQRLVYACKPMTVCIAALADVGKSLVMACDSMLSTIEFSGDKVAFKLYPLSDRFHWWAMIAADDLSHVVPIIDAATLRLLDLSDANNTVAHTERAVVAAYQDVRTQYAQDFILVPIGLTMQDLKEHRPDNSLVDELNSVDLRCQVLVAGFDRDGDGHIFSVENPGIGKNHDPVGWASIGAGGYSATSTLLHHSVNFEMELARVLYHVCEAKFMSESAAGRSVATGKGKAGRASHNRRLPGSELGSKKDPSVSHPISAINSERLPIQESSAPRPERAPE
jgi:hypothetical protein